MTVASFVASQRAEFDVPHALSCRALGVSESWFYKWHDRPATARQSVADSSTKRAEVLRGRTAPMDRPGSMPI